MNIETHWWTSRTSIPYRGAYWYDHESYIGLFIEKWPDLRPKNDLRDRGRPEIFKNSKIGASRCRGSIRLVKSVWRNEFSDSKIAQHRIFIWNLVENGLNCPTWHWTINTYACGTTSLNAAWRGNICWNLKVSALAKATARSEHCFLSNCLLAVSFTLMKTCDRCHKNDDSSTWHIAHQAKAVAALPTLMCQQRRNQLHSIEQ